MGVKRACAGERGSSGEQLPRRPYGLTGVQLSVLGLGGMTVVGLDQRDADSLVTEAIERGVNYFDVGPSYGDGEAEEKLGEALRSYREQVFLACKTGKRGAAAAQEQLTQSLGRLHTDHLDLYQFHAVNRMEEVEEIFGPGGAAETFVAARDKGIVRYLGFSSHSTEAALAMLERFGFDSVLFPINYVCYAQGGLGPQVVARAREKGVARLALKVMARTVRAPGYRGYPNCWYEPIDDPVLARQALRFAFSEDITAAIPPADAQLFRLALHLAADLEPLSQDERDDLLASSEGVQPIFRAKG